MRIGSRLHANRQMQAYTNRQLLDGPCPIIWHEAISAVVWTHRYHDLLTHRLKTCIFFYIMMTKTPPTNTKRATSLWARVSMLQWITAVALSKYKLCALPLFKQTTQGKISVIVGPMWFCAHCNIYQESRGCWTPRRIFQNICLTPGAMSSNWSRLNYTLFKAY